MQACGVPLGWHAARPQSDRAGDHAPVENSALRMHLRRLAAFLVRQRGVRAIAGLVPLLVRRLVEQAAAEKPGAALEDLAGARTCGPSLLH